MDFPFLSDDDVPHGPNYTAMIIINTQLDAKRL